MAWAIEAATGMRPWRVEALHKRDGTRRGTAVCGRLDNELRVVDGLGFDADDAHMLVMVR